MAVPGLGFRLFGFPVRVEPWFVVVAAVLGWNSDSTIGSLLVWIAVVFVSVLVHELGHAVAARSRGADPVRIDLYGFGGLTRFSPRRPLGRVEAAGISLAGPFSGMALGGVVALIVAVVGLPDGDLPEFAVRAALWVNLGWGLINLLPVLPLDGGHVLTAVLPGDEGARHTRAAWASVVIGAAAAVAFFAIGLPFGAMLFVMFAASNLATARSAPRRNREAALYDSGVAALERLGSGDPRAVAELERVIEHTESPGARNGFMAALVEHLAMNGEPGRARTELERLPGTVPPSLYALVTVCESGGASGLDELAEVFVEQGDPASARYVVLGFVRAGRAGEVGAIFRRATPAGRSAASLDAARRAATAIGAPTVLHELGTLA